MAVNQSQVMWQKFVQGLNASSAGQGLDPATFLPTGGLTNADWEVMDVTGLPAATGSAPPGSLIVAALEKWANVMPAWATSYAPSALNLYDQYKTFLYSIQLKGGNPALQQIADGYAAKVTAAQAQLSADRLKYVTAWSTFNTAQASLPSSAQMTFQQWYTQNGWDKIINNDQNALAAQTTLYNQALANVGGPDYRTISDAQASVALSAAAGNGIQDASGTLWPGFTVTPGLNDWYVSALQTLASGAEPAINLTIKLDDSNSSSLVNSSFLNVGAGVSYDSFFWGGSAAASYSQSSGAQDYTSLVQGMTMTYTAQAAQLFSFGPANWFNSSIVADFYDQISPTSALANKPLFGPTGILNLRSGQALVVLKPSVTLTSDRKSIQALYQQLSQDSSSSFSIGGFCWSAQANHAQGTSHFASDVTTSADGTSVTITDNTNSPKVLGVVPIALGKAQ
ncbi:MAG: hypothetical protein ACOZE7_16625 [Pseudomonadota bacterium]